MTVAIVLSRLALGIALTALFLTLSDVRIGRRHPFMRSKTVMALATLAIGMALFGLFFGLVAGCDRL